VQIEFDAPLVKEIKCATGRKGLNMKKTNFDLYLEEQLKDPDCGERYERAGEAWDVALQIDVPARAGRPVPGAARSQTKNHQQQVSRLESPAYEDHSLSMLRRVAAALHVRVRVVLEPLPAAGKSSVVREEAVRYKATRRKP
jgi:hypothetical protein